jgi:transglutaminase-like putative cysteine protease
MHAWTEVHLPGAGWKGFDPTNGMIANNYFIPCAVASEPRLTSPIQGSYYHPQALLPSTMEVALSLEALA